MTDKRNGQYTATYTIPTGTTSQSITVYAELHNYGILYAEYWWNGYLNWNGSPAVTGTITQTEFDWGSGGPISGYGVDGFSTRFTGYIVPPYTETYTFWLLTDDYGEFNLEDVNRITVTCCSWSSGYSVALNAG